MYIIGQIKAQGGHAALNIYDYNLFRYNLYSQFCIKLPFVLVNFNTLLPNLGED